MHLFNSREEFEKICKQEVVVPGMTVMRDVAIAKSEFVPDQKAVTKIQTWHDDDVLWEYCCRPEVIQGLDGDLCKIVALGSEIITCIAIEIGEKWELFKILRHESHNREK